MQKWYMPTNSMKIRLKYHIFRADKNDKRHKDQGRRKISYFQSRICFRKIVGQHRMSNFVGHGCHKVLHVKVLLFVMQNFTCIT